MQLIIRDDRSLLAASPNVALMDMAGQLEGYRRWSKSGLVIETTGHNIEVIQRFIRDITLVDKRESKDTPAPVELAHEYEFKTPPYEHQKTALNRINGNKSFALFMEQGTGKTKVILDHAANLYARGEIRAVLVIAPKGVHRQWIDDQAQQHCPGEWRGGYWPQSVPPRNEGLQLYAMNYDALRSKRGKSTALNYIQHNDHRVLLVLDESHFVKNHRSQRWRNCYDLRQQVLYAILSTGTPIAKDLCDEWAQLKLLDESILGIRYITHFRNEYCVMGGYQGKKVIGSRNVERFRERTAPRIYRVRKADIGIEPKQYSTFRFTMTKEQQKYYKELANNLILEIDSGVIKTVDNAAAKVLHLQQISNGFITLPKDGTVGVLVPSGGKIDVCTEREHRSLFPDNDNPRITALIECLDGMDGESVIVWCRFHYDVESISAALDAQGVSHVQYYGKTPDKARHEAVRRFLEGTARVFIATASTGGVGLNLQGRCTNAIYYSNSENSIHRWQSEDRIHRIGIHQPITYTDIVAKGSRDLHILANLRRKKSLSDLTLGDLRGELESAVF